MGARNMATPNTATRSLASMSVGALLKLRNDIGAVLSHRAEALKKELHSLGEDYAEVGRIALYGKKRAKQMAVEGRLANRQKSGGKKAAGRKRRTHAAVANSRTGTKRAVVAKRAKKKSARRT